MGETLRAGAAITDITPSKGVSLGGYPHHPRYNEGVHDPLYAACLFLDDGNTQLALVTMDVIMYSKRYVREVRKAASVATGIPPGNIMICCSHSHSAPWASPLFTMDAIERGQAPDESYVEPLNAKLVDLITDASRDTFDAAIGVETGFCGREQGVGGNRRNPKGIADPEVWTIGVQDRGGTWRAILAKYALHPTFLHSDNFLVSADYPGYIRSHIAETFPEAVFLFAQGTAGNQSPRYFRSGKTFAEAERVGSTIGSEVVRVLQNMTLSTECPLCVDSAEVEIDIRELPSRREAESYVEELRREWDALKEAGADERDVWNAELRFLGAEDTMSLIELSETGSIAILDDELPSEVQVIGIGDTRIVCLPGELFVEFGLTVQYRAPFERCFVIELANGVLPGYAATAQAYAVGGYETGASLLTGRSGEQLVDAAVGLLKKTTTPR